LILSIIQRSAGSHSSWELLRRRRLLIICRPARTHALCHFPRTRPLYQTAVNPKAIHIDQHHLADAPASRTRRANPALAGVTPSYSMILFPIKGAPTMPAVEKRTISLPPAQAQYIDSLVETGSYGSASEVVRAGLRALQERDAVVERWLKDEVIPVYDAMRTNPERGLSGEQVKAAMRAHHADHVKKGARGS
jgi:antitoxin ParD1/3/4